MSRCDIQMNTRSLSLALISMLAACVPAPEPGVADPAAAPASPGPVRLAFEAKDDFTNPDSAPERLAAALAASIGREVEIYAVTGQTTALEALRFGHADAAFLDGGAAWVGWKRHGLEVIAADLRGDGRTHYDAQAWVLADGPIESWEDLEGARSCHTGWLKSAGMLMPMGALIGAGVADVVGDPSDLESLRHTIEAFFSSALVPEAGSPYYSYKGALRCLAEGEGDVAFVRDTTWHEHCGGDRAPEWCPAYGSIRGLEPFGRVPSHPVVVNPASTDQETIDALLAALLALNDTPEGRAVLADVLETPGLVATSAEEHLGSYADAVGNVPGLMEHLDD